MRKTFAVALLIAIAALGVLLSALSPPATESAERSAVSKPSYSSPVAGATAVTVVEHAVYSAAEADIGDIVTSGVLTNRSTAVPRNPAPILTFHGQSPPLITSRSQRAKTTAFRKQSAFTGLRYNHYARADI